jgi:carbon starvation protein
MNSIAVVAGSGFIFWLGYVFYAEKIVRIFKPDKHRKTPAQANYDGVDYVPAKHWSVLFGHHFSSIAGAAPVIGPILAVSIWGWAPTLLWVVLGTVLIGGVHDYCSLMLSVRHKGRSIADFAQDTISKNAKIIFLSFAWITLILVISVFVYLCAKTLVLTPSIVLPSIGLIPLSIAVGFLLYAKRLFKKHNQISVTLLGLVVLGLLIYAGSRFPISLDVAEPVHVWSVILLVYAYFASIAPVHILLQPRDYLSAFLLFAGLLFGYIGVIAHGPSLEFPAFIGFHAGTTHMLWPVLFVTVACGAVSGFHSLVASGTTSKQLDNEVHAKKIGYGAMVAEGFLALLALLVVSAAYSSIKDLAGVVNSGGGPVHAFGFAYGRITASFFGAFGGLFAVLILNAFIFTTLDTATRIARYLTQELFRINNRYIATLVVVSLSGWLGISGEWNQIWPIFGAANQLIAALALIVVTSWLLSSRKPVIYTILPTLFMILTAIAALFLKIVEYCGDRNILLAVIASILLFLAFIVLYEAVFVGIKNHRRRRNVHA